MFGLISTDLPKDSVELFFGILASSFLDKLLKLKGGIISNLWAFFFQLTNSEKLISLRQVPHVIVDFYCF